MPGSGKRWTARIVGMFAVLGAGLAACSGTSSSTLPPTTGILIRAETLTSGKGCGTDATQIFKYVVLVHGYGPLPESDAGPFPDPAEPASYQVVVTSNVFDCYTDGAFISLPAINGNSTFRLEVFAYNRAAYDAARGVLDAASIIGRGRSDQDRARLGGYAGELRSATAPTWTTECSATQQENVQALASCRPLGPGLTGLGGSVGPTTITLETSTFTLPDGRVASCTNPTPADGGLGDAGPGDAGSGDAGPDDAGGAPDAGSVDAGDAGAPIGFAQVRIRTRAGTRVLADDVLPCPRSYVLEVAADPGTYELDVGLLDGAGNLVDPGAQTLCRASTVAGASSSAVCSSK